MHSALPKRYNSLGLRRETSLRVSAYAGCFVEETQQERYEESNQRRQNGSSGSSVTIAAKLSDFVCIAMARPFPSFSPEIFTDRCRQQPPKHCATDSRLPSSGRPPFIAQIAPPSATRRRASVTKSASSEKARETRASNFARYFGART